jgi:hypothetical protein
MSTETKQPNHSIVAIFKPSSDSESSSSSAGPSGSVATTTRPAIVALFDVNVGNLNDAPKLKGSNAFDYDDWKKVFKHWAVNKGVWRLINNDAATSGADAVDFLTPYGLTPSQCKEKFTSLHQRVWGSICISTHDAMGTSLPDSIASEQERAENKFNFLEFNCNYLWTKIKDTFEKKAGMASTHCLDEFLSLRMEPNENPLQFRQRLDVLIHRFNNIEGDVILPGERISQGTKFYLATRALPRKWETTIQAVISTNHTPTLDHLFSALQRIHDNNHSQSKQNKSDRDSALSFNERQDEDAYAFNERRDRPNYKSKDGSSSSSSSKSQDRNPRYKGNNYDPNYKSKGTKQTPIKTGTGAGTSTKDDDDDHVSFPFIDELTLHKLYQSEMDGPNEAFSPEVMLALHDSRAGHFIIDSGSSKHIVFDKRVLSNVQSIEPFRMFGATGQHATVKQMGSVELSGKVSINNVCYTPNATHNLLSLAKLLDDGCDVTEITKSTIRVTKRVKFRNDNHHTQIHMRFNRKPGEGVWRMMLPEHTRREMYQRSANFSKIREPGASSPSPQAAAPSSAVAALMQGEKDERSLFFTHVEPNYDQTIFQFHEKETDQAKLWHNRLGHQNKNVIIGMNELYKLGITKEQLRHLDNCVCDDCIKGKGRATRIGQTIPEIHRVHKILGRLHIDLLGWVSVFNGRHMQRTPTMGGNLYAIHITDEESSYTAPGLLKHKSDATSFTMETIELWESQTNEKVKEIIIDGGELVNNEFKDYCAKKGINLKWTTRDHAEHNGKSERRGGTLKEIARAMMSHSGVPSCLWGEAFNYATFVYNNSPQPVINGRIPAQVLFGKSTSPNHIKVFGCDAFVLIPESQRGPFQPRYRKGMFVGHDLKQNCDRIMNAENNNRIIFSRDTKCLENSFTVAESIEGKRDYFDESLAPLVILQDIINSNANPTTLVSNASAPMATANSNAPMPATNAINSSNDDSEVQFNEQQPDDEQKDEILPEPIINQSAVIAASPPPATLPQRVSREVKQLQTAAQNINFKPTPAVPNRGQHKLTYTSSTVSAQVTETLPSVSSRGRVTKPTNPNRLHLLIDEDNNLVQTSGEMLPMDVEKASPTIRVPETYDEAMKGPQRKEWTQAILDETTSHTINETWDNETESYPRDQRPITGRWVFATKLDENGKVIRYKARLVGRGFQQQAGVNYDETFAPVTKLKSVKLLLSLAATHDLEIKQLDFDTAFLNATLDHEVYMTLPPGTSNPGKVVRLVKSLYGLKQAGHDWNKLISRKIIDLGYTQLKCDTCLFIKRTQQG